MNIFFKITLFFTSALSLPLLSHQVTAHNTTPYTLKIAIPSATFEGTPKQGNSLQFLIKPEETQTITAPSSYCIKTIISITNTNNGQSYTSTLPFEQSTLRNGYACTSYTFTIKERVSETETSSLYAE
jgi:hypothetical protein